MYVWVGVGYCRGEERGCMYVWLRVGYGRGEQRV